MLNKIKKPGKKAQEEIIGFVLIIILVSVIVVVFLGIMLRRPNKSEDIRDREVSNFLSSMLSYTSKCSVNNRTYKQVNDLIDSCLNNEICDNRVSACTTLDSTINKLINENLNFGEDYYYKGYNLTIYKYENLELIYTKGNKTSVIRGASNFLPGNIEINLEVYK